MPSCVSSILSPQAHAQSKAVLSTHVTQTRKLQGHLNLLSQLARYGCISEECVRKHAVDVTTLLWTYSCLYAVRWKNMETTYMTVLPRQSKCLIGLIKMTVIIYINWFAVHQLHERYKPSEGARSLVVPCLRQYSDYNSEPTHGSQLFTTCERAVRVSLVKTTCGITVFHVSYVLFFFILWACWFKSTSRVFSARFLIWGGLVCSAVVFTFLFLLGYIRKWFNKACVRTAGFIQGLAGFTTHSQKSDKILRFQQDSMLVHRFEVFLFCILGS